MVFSLSKIDSPTIYPEYGLHSVAGTNVFGMKEFIRLFHGTSDDEGFTAYYSPGGTRLATQAEVLAAFGDAKAVADYHPKIVTAVNEAKLNRVALKWVATETGDPGKALDYWQ